MEQEERKVLMKERRSFASPVSFRPDVAQHVKLVHTCCSSLVLPICAMIELDEAVEVPLDACKVSREVWSAMRLSLCLPHGGLSQKNQPLWGQEKDDPGYADHDSLGFQSAGGNRRACHTGCATAPSLCDLARARWLAAQLSTRAAQRHT